MEKKLYRDTQHKVIGGVCSGLAEYFNVDVSIVRVLFLASLILKGGGFLIYIVLLIVLPKKPYFFNDPTVDYKVPNGPPFTGPVVEPKKSNGSVIAGTILIGLGTMFLINQLDIIPHIYWGRVWPVILIVIGLVFMFSRPKSEPWKEDNWKEATEKKEEPTAETTDNSSTTDSESTNDNPPNVQL
jgi:phage shock protein PspC (stress-responsive transcriptional regulator)